MPPEVMSPEVMSPDVMSRDVMSPDPTGREPLTGDVRPRLRRRFAMAAVAIVACVAPTACDYAAASPAQRPTTTRAPGGGHQHGGHTTAPAGASVTATPTDDAGPTEGADTTSAAPTTGASAIPTTTAPRPAGGANNGLDVLGRDCSTSKLQPHTGFQIAPACVSTEFGEVSAPDRNPSLLITKAPGTVAADTPFTISVSTRNLVRDRFLGAAAGGYYLESSFLDPNGLQRGHFHTACRILPSTDVAPDAAPVPAFFVATQDNGGGSKPDTVVVHVTGLPRGEAQCTVWAGDGSHRVPMMQRANQTPAIDSVRITVR